MPSLNFWKIKEGLNLSPKTSAPSSPSNGDAYYNSTSNLFQFYQNGGWINFNSGTSITTPGSTTINAISTWGNATGSELLNTGITIDTSNQVFIQSGLIGLKIGADTGATTLTNTTAKSALIGAYHYTNTEEPMAMLYANPTASSNDLYIGGGTSRLNSANNILFYTGANSTTSTGSEAARIDSVGGFLLGTAVYSGQYNNNEKAFFRRNLTAAAASSSAALTTYLFVSGNTAITSGASHGFYSRVARSITATTTDTGPNVLVSGRFDSTVNVATSQTYTNTQTNGFTTVNINLTDNSGAGTLALTNNIGLRIEDSSTNSGTRKAGIKITTITGATNNASITDNVAFTGNHFINSTSTNPSLFSGLLNINGGASFGNTRTVTTTATVNANDTIILCNQSAAFALTLPTATDGRLLVIKDFSNTATTNNITVTRAASDTIDGATTFVMNQNKQSITLIGSNGAWSII